MAPGLCGYAGSCSATDCLLALAVLQGDAPSGSKASQPRKRKAKEGGAPSVRVKSGYMLFCEANRAAFKEAHPEAGVVDIMKLMAEAWREAEQQVRCSWTGGYVEPFIEEQVLHACVLSRCCRGNI